MNIFTCIEMVAVFTGILFIVLLIRENIWCWLFGIVSSLLSIVLFTHAKLYSEAILYTYYVVMGVYGWYAWQYQSKDGQNSLLITQWNWQTHVGIGGIGAMLAVLLGYISSTYTDANNPYIDATTTVFSFIATYMEARKVLSTWLFWIVINGMTIGLYHLRSLDFYAVLMFIYFMLSFVGYVQWKRKFSQQVKSKK